MLHYTNISNISDVDRNDNEYSMKRRLALEEYLRGIVKIPILKKVSYSLHEFVNVDGTNLFTPEDMIYFEETEADRKKRWWVYDTEVDEKAETETETETDSELFENNNSHSNNGENKIEIGSEDNSKAKANGSHNHV